MPNSDDSLKLQVASLGSGIDADAYIFIVRTTLAALEELNEAVSKYGSVNLQWQITDAGMRSPLFATLHGVSTAKDNGHDASQVIGAFVDGLGELEHSDVCPHLFNEV